MIEKHYSAFIVDESDDLLRRRMLRLSPAPVAPLRAVPGGRRRAAVEAE
jgi:hypothetical protein